MCPQQIHEVVILGGNTRSRRHLPAEQRGRAEHLLLIGYRNAPFMMNSASKPAVSHKGSISLFPAYGSIQPARVGRVPSGMHGAVGGRRVNHILLPDDARRGGRAYLSSPDCSCAQWSTTILGA